MSKLVNAYTVSPDDIEPGDIMCFVIKAMVTYRDADSALRYRIYRCPWKGTLDDVPQGTSVADMESVCEAVFPSLAVVGKPG